MPEPDPAGLVEQPAPEPSGPAPATSPLPLLELDPAWEESKKRNGVAKVVDKWFMDCIGNCHFELSEFLVH